LHLHPHIGVNNLPRVVRPDGSEAMLSQSCIQCHITERLCHPCTCMYVYELLLPLGMTAHLENLKKLTDSSVVREKSGKMKKYGISCGN